MAMPCSFGGGDHLVVADAAARLDHGGDPGVGRGVEAVAEREEGVARAHAAVGPAGGAVGGDAGRVEPVLLAGADAERLAVLGVDDRVAGDRGAHLPGEREVVPLRVGRLGRR